MINFKEIFSVTLILFSVIDILGSIPVVISILKTRRKNSSREGHNNISPFDGWLFIFRTIHP